MTNKEKLEEFIIDKIKNHPEDFNGDGGGFGYFQYLDSPVLIEICDNFIKIYSSRSNSYPMFAHKFKRFRRLNPFIDKLKDVAKKKEQEKRDKEVEKICKSMLDCLNNLNNEPEEQIVEAKKEIKKTNNKGCLSNVLSYLQRKTFLL